MCSFPSASDGADVYFMGRVDFIHSATLQDVARTLSDTLFGGAPFVGLEDTIWDEVPAVYLSKRVMGLYVALGGYGGEDGYTLRLSPSPSRPTTDQQRWINISHYMATRLREISGFIEVNPVVIEPLDKGRGQA